MSRHLCQKSINRNRNTTTTYGSVNITSSSNLTDSTMIIDAAADDAVSSAEDVHVKELRRMFDLCDDDGDGALTVSGLERLCEELRLDDHKEYIVNQLLSSKGAASGSRTIGFDIFKVKFIQLLPELVDFSSTPERTKPKVAGGSPIVGERQTGSNNGHTKNAKGNFCQESGQRSSNDQRRYQSNVNSKPLVAPRRSILIDNMEAIVGELVAGASDQDTSNDILSDFSDDERRRQRRSSSTTAFRKRKNRSSLGSDSASSSNASFGNSLPKTTADVEMGIQSTEKSPNIPTSATITASDVEQILNGLGLADCGYLGRYEFRILCQHLGLNGLTTTELNGLFNQLDKDGDGRIAVNDFLLVCPPSNSLPPPTSVEPVQCDIPLSNSFNRQKKQRNSISTHVEQEAGNDCDKEGKVRISVSFTEILADGIRPTSSSNTINDRSNDVDTSSPVVATSFMKTSMNDLKSRSVVLFGSLDENKTGHAKREDVLRYWDSIGIENSCDILKKLRFTERQRWIDLKELSTALDQELCEAVEFDQSLFAAFLTLKAEVCFLRESFDESREQALHYLRELQQLNQRNAMLIDEMDQNHQNLEVKAQTQLRELEEKQQSRINALENKFRDERDQWQLESREKDEFLHKLEQSESTLQSRLRHLERENTKLKAELDDVSQMLKEIEELNRDLRQALKEAALVKKQRQSNAENSITMNGHSLTLNDNGRSKNEALRKVIGSSYDSPGCRTGLIIQRSTMNGKSNSADANLVCSRCASTSSTPAKKRVKYTPPSAAALLKRRRLQLNHYNSQNQRTRDSQTRSFESSDFESEPEPIIFKPKFKRPLKKRQRLALIANRERAMGSDFGLGNTLFSKMPENSDTSTSTPEEGEHLGSKISSFAPFSIREAGSYNNGVNAGCFQSNDARQDAQLQLAVLDKNFSSQKEYYIRELKMQTASMAEEHSREMGRLLERSEREKEQLKNDYKRELEALIHSAMSEKRSALEHQEDELRKQFESQRRDAEIKWATERNVMERKFAEEKMEMMERLQNDFEAELSRLRNSISGKLHDVSPSSPRRSKENQARLERTQQENMQLTALLDSSRSDLQKANINLDLERTRCAKIEEDVVLLQSDIVQWQSRCEELDDKNTLLQQQVRRLERDLRDVSREYVALQQRTDELELKRLEEMSSRKRVTTSDTDVQTDHSSIVSVKDAYAQVDTQSDKVNVNEMGIVSSIPVYSKCQMSLAHTVEELEQLLQSAESGFEEEVDVDEMVDMETEPNPIMIKAAYWNLRKRLTKAQAKFKEIRSDLIGGQKEIIGEIYKSDESEASKKSNGSFRNFGAHVLEDKCTQKDEEKENQFTSAQFENEDDEFDDFGRDISLFDDDSKEEQAQMESISALTNPPVVIAQMAERLRDENILLKARLLEQRRLTGQLTDRLQQQMRDTVKVSEVAQRLFTRCKSMAYEQSTK